MIRWKKYRDWRLKQKLLVYSSLFIFCTLFLVTSISYLKYTRDFADQSSDRVQQIIEQVSFNIDAYLDDLYRLSLAPYRNEAVMRALEEPHDGTSLAKLEKRRVIEDYLDEVMIYPRKDINRVFVITDGIYSSGRTQMSVSDTNLYKHYEWYKQAMSSKDTIFVPVHMQQFVNDRGPQVFSIVKQLRSIRNSEELMGVIKVDANYTGIETICRKADMGNHGGLFIVDNQENIIYESTRDLDAGFFYKQIQGTNAGSLKVHYQGDSYLINATLIPRSNWSILAVNSLTELNAKAAETRNFGFGIAILSAVCAVIALYWFLDKFLTPLLTVVRLMREVERGDLSVRFPDNRGDEIGYLGASFNGLVSRISSMLQEKTKLVEQVYETQLLQKEAQVMALQDQIKPHFLFNTLNMIALEMDVGKKDKAIDHIYKLSSILRSMTQSDKDITLRREIELLIAYLTIQSSRYDGRLDYEVRIDPSLCSMQVPALLFQPIVENAVIHGCEAKRTKTTIRIYSVEHGDKVCFHIEDTGVGMDPAALAKLRSSLSGTINASAEPGTYSENVRKGTGIGLANVNKRIKLKYGPEYGLSVDSTLGQGTAVTLTLPLSAIERQEK